MFAILIMIKNMSYDQVSFLPHNDQGTQFYNQYRATVIEAP